MVSNLTLYAEMQGRCRGTGFGVVYRE